MALNEKLALIISANPDQAVKSFEKVGIAADRHLGRAEDKTQRMQLAMASFGAKAVAVGAVAGVALYGLAQSASDLAESQNKVNVVFGEGASIVRDFAKNADTAFGQSERAALNAASDFGTLFTNIGKSSEEAANMSLEMTKLASDMASFSNTSPEEAVVALGAALRGEQEPIRRYGVLLSDQVLKQRALSEGLIETTTGTLPPAIRAQAAYYEILAQTSKQQGDFARTSQGAANQQRIFAAQLENLKAGVGAGVLPLFQNLLYGLNGVGSAFSDLPDGVKGATGALAGLATTGALVVGGLSLAGSQILKLKEYMTVAEKGAGVFGTSLSGVGLAAIGITTVLTIAGLAAKKSADDKRKAQQAEEEVANAIQRDAGKIGGATRDLVAERIKQQNQEDNLRKSGIELARVQNAIATENRIAGSSYQLLQKAQNGGAAAAQEMANSTQYAASASKDYISQLDQVIIDLAKAGQLDEGLAENLRGTSQEITRQQEEYKELGASVGVAAEAMPKFIEGMEQGKDSTQSKVDAMQELNKELDEYYSNVIEIFDAELGYSNATRTAADSIDKLNLATIALNDARKTSDPSDDILAEREYSAALDDAGAAALAQADAQVQAAKSMAEANGQTLDATFATSIYRSELQKQAESLAPGSPLRSRLEGYIAELDAAAAPRGGLLTLNAQQAIEELQRFYSATQQYVANPGYGNASRLFRGYADGGPVSGGKAILVGERGPEIFTPSGNGYITPNSRLSGGGSSGSVVINISAMDITTGSEAAIRMLEEYCRNNGQLPSSIKVA